MQFDPTYEIDDDTVAIGDRVRVPAQEHLAARPAGEIEMPGIQVAARLDAGV